MNSLRTLVCVGCLLFSSVVTALANDVHYPTEDGHRWWMWAQPNGGNVGDCYGNCGAGCSDGWNPCGGRHQYWDLTITGGPNDVPGYEWPETVCEGDQLLEVIWGRYEAWGNWTYYGHVAVGCIAHDAICPEFWLVGCLGFAGCGSEWDDEWSYDTYFVGERRYQVTYYGSCSNPPDPI
jgi:hypothetical protein